MTQAEHYRDQSNRARRLAEAVKDPELLNEAAKANLEINPGSGEELDRNVKELLRLDPSVVARLKEILK